MTIKSIEFYNDDITLFLAIKNGFKKTEVRALDSELSTKAFYNDIKPGDQINFFCGNDSILKRVTSIHKYKSLECLLNTEKLEDIEPGIEVNALRIKLLGFPGYPDRIKKYGLIAIRLADE